MQSKIHRLIFNQAIFRHIITPKVKKDNEKEWAKIDEVTERVFSNRGHGPPGLSGRSLEKTGFLFPNFWVFQHVCPKSPLDILFDLVHKNFTGRLPVFGCCGGLWSYYILGFSLTQHTILIFSIFHP